eukprot:10873974-Alexandrium_andersonii.AAC.1
MACGPRPFQRTAGAAPPHERDAPGTRSSTSASAGGARVAGAEAAPAHPATAALEAAHKNVPLRLPACRRGASPQGAARGQG